VFKRLLVLVAAGLVGIASDTARAQTDSCSCSAGSGPIKVERDGVCLARYADNADITINVGVVNGPTFIRIYDSTAVPGISLPTNSVRSITVNGNVASGSTTARLDLVIVGRECVNGGPIDPGFNFLPSPTITIDDYGVYNLGEGQDNAILVTDTELLKRTRLVAATVNDVYGQINVGHIYRLQAGLLTESAPSGMIDAVIQTHADDYTDIFDDRLSIEVIRCNKGIKGTITAYGESGYTDIGPPLNNDSYASIRLINVGPYFDPNNNDPSYDRRLINGIKGTISAPQGYIREIITTAPIGDADAASSIWAADGIFHIRSSGSTSAAPKNVDFRLDVNTSGFGGFSSYAVTGVPKDDGAIQLIETAGNVTGTIRAGNFARGNTPGDGGLADLGRVGIYARGFIDADVFVDYTMRGNIFARELPNATIHIGRTMEGVIAGWDRDNPNSDVVTEEITIGRNPAPDPLYLDWPPGLVGSLSSDYPRINDGTTNGWREQVYFFAGPMQGAHYSYIAVRHVKTLSIGEVTTARTPHSGSQTHYFNRPYIECGRIDNLYIDSLREGSLWSGRMDAGSLDTQNTDRTDDFTSIGHADIGCVGAHGDLWVWGFNYIDVEHNMLGEIVTPDLSESYKIIVGGGVSPDAQNDALGLQCTCAPEPDDNPPRASCAAFWDHTPVAEPAPRDEPAAPYGAIRFANANSLAGQVVIDANNETNLHRPDRWQGAVVVGDATSSPLVFSANASIATDSSAVGPTYSKLPADFGGGAIGLVPYALHAQQTDFLNPAPFLTSEFNDSSVPNQCDTRWLEGEFYGPVRAGQSWVPAASVLWSVLDCNSTPRTVDLTPYSYVNAPGTRRVSVSPRSGFQFGSGDFKVERSDPDNLFCALVDGDKAVLSFSYEFELLPDCDVDCSADPATCGNTGVCDSIDFNNDGLYPDNQDILDFQSVFGGGPCSTGDCNDIDFNNDGLYPDNADHEAFLDVFGGDCATCYPE